MTKLGTCKHTYKIQESWSTTSPLPPEDTPKHIAPDSDEAMTYQGWTKRTDLADDVSGSYTCEWLASHEALPPPVQRRSGSFVLSDGDCDKCQLYVAIEAQLFKKV